MVVPDLQSEGAPMGESSLSPVETDPPSPVDEFKGAGVSSTPGMPTLPSLRQRMPSTGGDENLELST